MKKTILFLLLIVFSNVYSNTDKYRLTLRGNPATSIVIGWNQRSGQDATVYYGTKDYGKDWRSYPSSKSVSRSVDYKSMNNKFARLTGLKPNTSYYFVLRDSDGTSDRFWFRTSSNNPTDRLSFISGGDSRNNRTARKNANKLVAKLKPNAILFGGDMTNDDTSSEWRTWFNDWQSTIASDGRMFPIVAARGNHEDSNNSIYKLFDVPSSEVYYAITFGGSLVTAYTLNTEISISGSQTDWLSSKLQSDNSTWKVAQYHKPMRPHAKSKSEGNSQYRNWASLFYDNRVKLVVESDAHTVKTTWPIRPSSSSRNDEGFVRDDTNGTVYAGEGCWGAPLRSSDDNKSWTRNSDKFNQFKWIFIDQGKIEIRTIKVDNSDSVGQVSNTNRFSPPSNLDIWKPSNGSVVTIRNQGGNQSGTQTIDKRIAKGSDDVEESGENGSVYNNSSDLELVNDGSKGNQIVGLRFKGLNIPKNATITKAYIQFATDETSTRSTNLKIRGHDVSNAPAFTTATNNVSKRTKTSASVNWSPSAWNSTGESGSTQRTSDIKSVIQEIINRSNWNSGNDMVMIITGTGKRTAESYEGDASKAPLIHIEYTNSTPPASKTIDKRIAKGSDDVEESGENGSVYNNSSDLELVNDGSKGNQIVGLRFKGLNIPKNASITKAYIQFATDETSTRSTNLKIRGHDVSNAPAFTTATNNVSKRTKTSASVNWSPSAWNSTGESGSTQRTSDIKSIIQEIINRSNWNSGNDMVMIITGTGKRTAESYEGDASKAPLIHIEYTESTSRGSGPTKTSVKTISLLDNVKLYPNPFKNSFNILIPNIESSISIELYDIKGKLIYNDTEQQVNDVINIKTEYINTGVYILKIKTGSNYIIRKLIKK